MLTANAPSHRPCFKGYATRPRCNGFTLLEILISLAIFALLSSAIAGQTTSSVRVQQSLETKRVATQLVENTIEQYRLMETLATDGRKRQVVKYAERLWNVDVVIENTRRADMRVIKVAANPADSGKTVSAGKSHDSTVVNMIAYLGAH